MAVSGYIIHLYGWDLPFWIAIVASLLGIVFVLKIKDVPDEKPKSRSMSIKDYISKTHAISGIKTITFLSLVAHAILFITIFGFSPIDRKSTRLNSSHVSMSYAVFCLKKKEK